jgi:hypothetical protein
MLVRLDRFAARRLGVMRLRGHSEVGGRVELLSGPLRVGPRACDAALYADGVVALAETGM